MSKIEFQTEWNHEYWLKSNDLFVGVNTPDAIESNGDEANKLPPYSKRKGFLVDEYPACPDNWVRSHGKTTSYFVGVKKNSGLWLDFNKNSNHMYDVAMVISIQGVNPITGLPCTDAHLEQYIEKCPKCDIEFGPERFCKKCEFHWPKQNYLSTTAQLSGLLWLDGFRTAEGIVRQYILTEEKMRGVASNIIGKDRVYAIGISFFLSKSKKVQQISNLRSRSINFISTQSVPTAPGLIMNVNWDDGGAGTQDNTISNCDCKFYSPTCKPIDWKIPISVTATKEIKYKKLSSSDCSEDLGLRNIVQQLSETNNDPDLRIVTSHSFNPDSVSKVDTKQIEIGAGSNINQKISDDPEPLDFWRDEPESIICINYCFEEDCEKIISQGRIPIEAHKDGFLKDIPVGNQKKVLETA